MEVSDEQVEGIGWLCESGFENQFVASSQF